MIYSEKIYNMIKKSKRPILLVGAGCNRDVFQDLINCLDIPYFLTWAAKDYTFHNQANNFGNFGIMGKQINNIVLKKADLIIALGTRLDTHEVMGNWRKGKLIMIDIDEAELAKQKVDLKVHGDVNLVLKDLIKIIEKEIFFPLTKPEWGIWWDKLYSLKKLERVPKSMPYQFIDKLSDEAKEGDIIVTDAGQTLSWTMQTWKVKDDQRLFTAFNHSPMGYALPASIGAYFAKDEKAWNVGQNVICIIGDGGLQMNLQEIQTIAGYKLPIKIFVMDNNGYGMIKQTLSGWKSLKNNVACDPHIADLSKIANAHNITYKEINSKADLKRIPIFLRLNEPVIIRVKILEGTKIEPKLKYGDELDDLTPKLNKKERREINEILR